MWNEIVSSMSLSPPRFRREPAEVESSGGKGCDMGTRGEAGKMWILFLVKEQELLLILLSTTQRKYQDVAVTRPELLVGSSTSTDYLGILEVETHACMK